MSTPLEQSLQATLDYFTERGVPLMDLAVPVPDEAIDFFSNDYLSFASNADIRGAFLEQLSGEKQIMGSRGS